MNIIMLIDTYISKILFLKLEANVKYGLNDDVFP